MALLKTDLSAGLFESEGLFQGPQNTRFWLLFHKATHESSTKHLHCSLENTSGRTFRNPGKRVLVTIPRYFLTLFVSFAER